MRDGEVNWRQDERTEETVRDDEGTSSSLDNCTSKGLPVLYSSESRKIRQQGHGVDVYGLKFDDKSQGWVVLVAAKVALKEKRGCLGLYDLRMKLYHDANSRRLGVSWNCAPNSGKWTNAVCRATSIKGLAPDMRKARTVLFNSVLRKRKKEKQVIRIKKKEKKRIKKGSLIWGRDLVMVI